ncbi:MAG: hypothetical protein GTO03_10580 [Planctomycetales bacterium]|nr:hypothetical protein [Planctomycetales bacterium]
MNWSWARPWGIVALVGYVAVIAATVLLLGRLRESQITRLSQPNAQEAWRDWRAAAAAEEAGKGPVQRRVPQSVEPPALVLLRDHFGVVVAATIIFGTLLGAVIVTAVCGALARSGPRERSEESRGEKGEAGRRSP